MINHKLNFVALLSTIFAMFLLSFLLGISQTNIHYFLSIFISFSVQYIGFLVASIIYKDD